MIGLSIVGYLMTVVLMAGLVTLFDLDLDGPSIKKFPGHLLMVFVGLTGFLGAMAGLGLAAYGIIVMFT